jgi:hypothetical protein
MHNIQQSFDVLLAESIDEVLGSLGEPVKNHVYMLLEEDFSITKNMLPHQIAEFSRFIHRLFGSHAQLIEIKCMKLFYSKIKSFPQFAGKTMIFEDTNFSFSEHIEKIRSVFST